MSTGSAVAPPPERFASGSAVALTLMLFGAILTVWVTNRWSVSVIEAGVLALAAIWSGRMIFRPYLLRGSFVLVPLAATVAVGLLQLATNQTVDRWETWNATLRWMAYSLSFFLALQIYSSPRRLMTFRLAILYFGFGLSVLSVLQFFTSPGKVFWLFPLEDESPILGPFPNRDHYAAFIELVFPIALFEALVNDQRTLLFTAMAGTMFASVIAGASRAGSILVILESAAVLMFATQRHLMSGRKLRFFLGSFLIVTLTFVGVVGWTTIWKRFQDPNPYRYRGEMLESAISMTRQRPWTGWGLGNFENVYRAYANFDNGAIVNHAHNDWAEWAAEGGLPFLVFVLTLAIGSLPHAARSVWGLGAISVFVHSFVDFPMQKPAIAAWVFVLLGAVFAEANSSARSGSSNG